MESQQTETLRLSRMCHFDIILFGSVRNRIYVILQHDAVATRGASFEWRHRIQTRMGVDSSFVDNRRRGAIVTASTSSISSRRRARGFDPRSRAEPRLASSFASSQRLQPLVAGTVISCRASTRRSSFVARATRGSAVRWTVAPLGFSNHDDVIATVSSSAMPSVSQFFTITTAAAAATSELPGEYKIRAALTSHRRR